MGIDGRNPGPFAARPGSARQCQAVPCNAKQCPEIMGELEACENFRNRQGKSSMRPNLTG
jgi:hypothetical protein